MAEKNYDVDDINPVMKKQMEIMNELCEKYPAVDFYRLKGSRKHGCRVMVAGEEMAEVWTDYGRKVQRIEEANVGSVFTNFIDESDKIEAIPVAGHDYSSMGGHVMDKYAYHGEWKYKWSHWLKTYDQLHDILEHAIELYFKQNDLSPDFWNDIEGLVRERDNYADFLKRS